MTTPENKTTLPSANKPTAPVSDCHWCRAGSAAARRWCRAEQPCGRAECCARFRAAGPGVTIPRGSGR